MSSFTVSPGSLSGLAAILVGATLVAGDASAQQSKQAIDRMIETLEAADTNNNGRLTQAELDKTLKNRFARMDRNRDGKANPDDAPGMARQQYLSRVTPIIQERDLNGDGALSYAEFSAPPLENFNVADTDKDGEVEIAVLIEAIKGRATAK